MTRPEKFQKALGYAAMAVASIPLIAICWAQIHTFEVDALQLTLSVLQDFFVGVLSVGFVLVSIDSVLYRFQKDHDESEAQKTLKKNLIRRLRSKTAYIAAQASEELQDNGWVGDGSLEKLHAPHANLCGVSLMGAKIGEGDFEAADLSGADLRGAGLQEANFEGAILKGTDLTAANLKGANFNGADLENAFLDGADMSGAYLGNANLKNASIYGSKIGWGADPQFNPDFDDHIHYSPTKFSEETCLPDETLWTSETDMKRFTGNTSKDE